MDKLMILDKQEIRLTFLSLHNSCCLVTFINCTVSQSLITLELSIMTMLWGPQEDYNKFDQSCRRVCAKIALRYVKKHPLTYMYSRVAIQPNHYSSLTLLLSEWSFGQSECFMVKLLMAIAGIQSSIHVRLNCSTVAIYNRIWLLMNSEAQTMLV